MPSHISTTQTSIKSDRELLRDMRILAASRGRDIVSSYNATLQQGIPTFNSLDPRATTASEPKVQAQMLKDRPLKLVLNTDVWVNYYLDRDSRHELAGRMVLAASQRNVALYTSVCCLKDTYSTINSDLKRMAQEAAACLGVETEEHTQDQLHIDAAIDAARVTDMLVTANDTAWTCITNLLELSSIIPAGQTEALRALTLRGNHDDFADDMLFASCLRIDADYLVSDIETLRHDSPIPALNLEKATELLESIPLI